MQAYLPLFDGAVAPGIELRYGYRKREPFDVCGLHRHTRETDFKAFSRLSDAEARFRRGWLQTDSGEFDSIAIFEVLKTENAREAAEAVKRADAGYVRLLRLKEPAKVELDKALSKINLDELALS